MSKQRIKAVQMFSQEEIFRAIAYGALKARAGRLAPGEIINIGEFELIVAEDENGEGIVVQIIETMANVESTGGAIRLSPGWCIMNHHDLFDSMHCYYGFCFSLAGCVADHPGLPLVRAFQESICSASIPMHIEI